jgi:hypothetical protein
MLLIFSSTNRRALALAIVLLIAGLAPASAIIGFCTRMPCFSHARDAATAFSTEGFRCRVSVERKRAEVVAETWIDAYKNPRAEDAVQVTLTVEPLDDTGTQA